MADDIASLGIDFDSSSVKTGVDDLNVLASVAARTGETVNQVQQRIRTAMAQGTQTTQQNTTAHQQNATATQAAAQGHAKAATSANVSARELAALTRVMGVMGHQLLELNTELGRLSQFFVVFGVQGAAVGAVIGGLVAGFEFLAKKAEELAAKATDISNFATVTGLTTDQIQALNGAAGELGLKAETVRAGISNMTVQFAEARKAQGSLYDQLLEINPELAKELQNARGTAEGINILARAFSQAGEAGNRLLQTAGGRGGVALAPLIKQIGEGGGFEHMVDHLGKAITLTSQEVKTLSDLSGELDEIRSQNRDLFAKMFSEETLQSQVKYNKQVNELLRYWQGVRDTVDQYIARIPVLNSASRLNPFAPNPYIQQGAAAPLNLPPLTTAGVQGAVGGQAVNIPEGPKQPSAEQLTALSNQYKQLTAALGPAASAQEKFNAKLAELNVALATGKFGIIDSADALKNYGRALADAKLELQVQQTNELMGVLGPAATEGEKLAQKMEALQLSALRAGASTEQLQRGLKGLQNEFDLTQQKANLSALGNAATLTEQYDLKLKILKDDLDHGRISQEAFNRGAGQLPVDKALEFQRATVSSLGDAATASEKYKLEIAELTEKLNQGRISQETFNRAVLQLNPAFQAVQKSAEAFLTTFVGGMIRGEKLLDSLHEGLMAVTQMAANESIKSLLKGDFMQAGVQAVIAGGSYLVDKLFGLDKRKKQQEEQDAAYAAAVAAQQEAQRKMLEQSKANAEAGYRAAVATLDVTTIEGQLAKRKLDREKEIRDLQEQGLDATALIAAQAAEQQQFLQQTAKTAREALAAPLGDIDRQMKQIADASHNLSVSLQELGKSTFEATQLAAAAIQRVREAFEKNLTQKLNEASGMGYINQVGNLIEEVTQMQKDAATLGVDPGKITAYFSAAAQRIIEETNLTGDAFKELIVLFPELSGLVHEASEKILELGKTIREYLNNLQFGQLSVLSPREQLAAAQAAFTDLLSKSKAGDQDAMAKLTQAADQLLKNARNFYGPSQEYQTVYAATTSALNEIATMSGARLGGLLGLAYGGMVPGGLFNVDSVMARFAGGGPIMLAGGEYVTRATSVNPRTLPILEGINRTGYAGGSDAVVAEVRALRRMFGQLIQTSASSASSASTNLNEIKGLRADIRQSAGEKNIRAAVK